MRLTHGQAKIREGRRLSKAYAAYHDAEQRCNNENHTSYKNYGGRGIKFKFSSFEQFFAELGNPPKGMTLDRKNNEGHYEPGNVHWASRKAQINNRRLRKDNTLGYEGIDFLGILLRHAQGCPTAVCALRHTLDYRDGVDFIKSKGKFRVRINGKFIGHFDTLQEAVKALQEAVKAKDKHVQA